MAVTTLLLVIYLIGVGAWVGFGLVLLFLAELLQTPPKDKTVLKYLAFSATWPVSYPAWALWVSYKDR